MASPDSFANLIVSTNERIRNGADLARRVAGFMLSIAELTNDRRLISATKLHWDGEAMPTDMREHGFGCYGATGVEFPQELYAGRLITPHEVAVFFDPDSSTVSYHFSEQVLCGDERGHEPELILLLSNTSNVIKARWQLLITDPMSEHPVSLPADSVLGRERNTEFGVVAADIQESLMHATFEAYPR